MKCVYFVWDKGENPRQVLPAIVVLILKGDSGEYRSINLLEISWKLIERVLYNRMSVIKAYACPHGFWGKRRYRTGIIRANLVQQLVSAEQVPLYGIVLDLWKSYIVMGRGRRIDTLKDAVLGPKAYSELL